MCPNPTSTKTNSQGILYRTSSSFGTPTIVTHGSAGHHWDYGFFNTIQSQNPYGTCSDSFVSSGVQHPGSKTLGCWTNRHDVWTEKTDASLNDDGTFTTSCPNPDVGTVHGGVNQDNGQSAVQTCTGYLIAGFTKSNDQVSAQHATAPGDVTCNHYDCTDDSTSDFWIALVSGTSGTLLWNESLGDAGEDAAYDIKRVPDNSYVVAGYGSPPISDNHGQLDFYVVNFELTQCDPPLSGTLSATPSGCTIAFSWQGKNCDQSFELKYRKVGTTTWTTVTQTGTSYTTPTLSTGSWAWKVKTKCSPNKYSDFVSGTSVTLACKLGDENTDLNNDLLSLYPNPSDGSFEISLQLLPPTELNRSSTITILDQVGKVVSTTQAIIVNGLLKTKMSTNNLPSGFYWVRVIVDEKSYQTKLILQKE